MFKQGLTSSAVMKSAFKPNISSRMLGACTARQPMINPVWWTGKNPVNQSDYIIDCSKYNITKDNVPKELIEKMQDTYAKTGVVLLTQTKMNSLDRMQEVAELILGGKMEYKGGANSRHNFENTNVYDTGAPGSAHIHYHHEMAYVGKSVKNIAFGCSKRPQQDPTQGWTYISDQVKATDWILTRPVGQKLREKGICYIRNLTDKSYFEKNLANSNEIGWNGKDQVGVYNHWQQSFGTDDPAEAQRMAEERGLVVEWGENGYMKTKFYVDAFEYDPVTDRNYLYSSVADDSMWFDTWPGVAELPTMSSYKDTHHYERPLKITYGDDTEFTRAELIDYVAAYDNFGLPIRWEEGDLAICCNYRWAHGRPSYELQEGDERVLGVTLGLQYDRVGQRADKWNDEFAYQPEEAMMAAN